MCLHFVPHKNSFKLHRFNPNQSNIRAEWFFKNFNPKLDLNKSGNSFKKNISSSYFKFIFLNFIFKDLEQDYSTPNYNFEILADLRSNENNELLRESLVSKNVKDAIKLFKVWLLKRDLNKVNRFHEYFIK